MSSNRTTSPPSRTPSIRNPTTPALPFTPLTPSGLRESHTVPKSPESTRTDGTDGTEEHYPSSSEPSPRDYPPNFGGDGAVDDDALDPRTYQSRDFAEQGASETTSLLRRPFELISSVAHPGPCDHGTFSPRLESRADSVRSVEGEGSKGIFGNLMGNLGMGNGSNGGKKKRSTTNQLVEQHGITNTTAMYVSISSMFQRVHPPLVEHSSIEDYENCLLKKSGRCALLILLHSQVSQLLHSLPNMDSTIPMGTFAGRFDSCIDSGIILSTNGAFLCCQFSPCPTDQRSIFIRLQSTHICNTGELSADDCWA